ncbi:MAG: molecular chaperone HtpG [Oscillospiraceae bacterium]|nr:molecular chaperone HtpG [Oscillospiraceae bacterium]
MKRQGQIRVESENMFPIIKKWLYSDKDIFLRELVSNGCDAISKLEKLRGIGEAPASEMPPRVVVSIDKEAKTLSISDNGIGMTEEEVEKYITQVAFSGAQEFIDHYKEKSDGGDAGIIGHFGLGFYSAFMVGAQVEIDTLSYKEGSAPVHWFSDGTANYEIGDGTRDTVGSVVTLHIAEGEEEFLEESRIREILHKYCQFMPYEIYLNPKHLDEQPPEGPAEADKAEGENAEGEKGEEKKAPEKDYPVNDTHPLWLKAPQDCTDEEYKSFYSKVFMDFNEPLFWIHLNVDYPFNLKGILYFPRQQNKVEVMPGEVKLFCNQVYVADNIEEIIPEFLLLLKGVIDCPDLPLNVSRSFLQNDGDVAKISKHITKKVSDKLHEIFNSDREQYAKYWEDISPFIKFGCIKDEKFYDRVKDILLLKTIDGEYKTLEEYPKGEDKKIFYVTDENQQSQYIRMFKAQNMPAAILSHAIDTHFISFLEYKNQEVKFARIDSDIGSAMKDGEGEGDAELQKEIAGQFTKALEDKNLEVKAEALKDEDTPAVILLSEEARRLQDMSAMYGMDFGYGEKPKVSIVLNSRCRIVKAIPGLDEENKKLVCRYIYDLATLSHRSLSAEEMADFMKHSVRVLELAAHME